MLKNFSILLKINLIIYELTFMSTHLSFLVKIIKNLKTLTMSFYDNFSLANRLEVKINVISGFKRKILKIK